MSNEAPMSRKDLYAEMWEFEERKKRATSVIVRGTGSNNVGEFTDKFKLLHQFLLNSAPRIANVHCISTESKLYRVTLDSKESRATLMKETSKLKDRPEYKDIYISRDLTLAQRNDMKAKRAARPRGQNREPDSRTTSGVSISRSQPLSGSNMEPIRNAGHDDIRANGAPPPAASSSGATAIFQ